MDPRPPKLHIKYDSARSATSKMASRCNEPVIKARRVKKPLTELNTDGSQVHMCHRFLLLWSLLKRWYWGVSPVFLLGLNATAWPWHRRLASSRWFMGSSQYNLIQVRPTAATSKHGYPVSST